MEMTVTRADVQKIVGDELESLRSRIIANHVTAKQVASGRTKSSIKVELTENGGILWGRFLLGLWKRDGVQVGHPTTLSA